MSETIEQTATVATAQPAPSFAAAYQGAMEEVAIWKKRALEAEELNRKFIAEINGPTYMGEPAQPAPIVPDLLEALKDMVNLVELMCPFDGPQQRKARAAIARATGEQP